MPFRLPTFNLMCNIWHGVVALPPVAAPDVIASCQLAWDGSGKVVVVMRNSANALAQHVMCLRLPPLTDIRSIECPSGPDTVEVPAGSGRFYESRSVDDVAKGFDNEYRQALIRPLQFPQPIP